MRVGNVEDLQQWAFVGEKLQVLVDERVTVARQVQVDQRRRKMQNDLAKASGRESDPCQVESRKTTAEVKRKRS